MRGGNLPGQGRTVGLPILSTRLVLRPRRRNCMHAMCTRVPNQSISVRVAPSNACNIGRYFANASGGSQCVQCPSNVNQTEEKYSMITLQEASRHVEECVCLRNYYRPSLQTVECKLCPQNAICVGATAYDRTPKPYAKAGSWGGMDGFEEFWECGDERSCEQGNTSSPSKCNEAYYGVLCMKCTPGHYRLVVRFWSKTAKLNMCADMWQTCA